MMYELQVLRYDGKWVLSGFTPHTFTTLEEAQVELVIRRFKYDQLTYRILDIETQNPVN